MNVDSLIWLDHFLSLKELEIASINYQILDFKTENQLSIKQTWSIFYQACLFAQNLLEIKKLAKRKSYSHG